LTNFRTVLNIGHVLITALDRIRGTDVTVTALRAPDDDRAADLLATITVGTMSATFAINIRQRAPFPNEVAGLDRLRRNLSESGRPLLVVPYVPESLGDYLVSAGWSWADDQGNYDIFDAGMRLRQRLSTSAPRATAHSMPTGSKSLAVIRSLMSSDDSTGEFSTTQVALRAGVSQPRASQVLNELASLELVDRAARGRWRPRRAELLDRFLSEYRGPGGTERFFYSLDTPLAVVNSLATLALPETFAVSADVAPDYIVPWRRPTLAIVYVMPDFPTHVLDVVEAHGRGDANLILRAPRDHSVFAGPRAVTSDGTALSLAHPSQIVWDLLDLGGADRFEAAGLVREWLLTNH
jgi:hypothetical protein